MTVTSPQWLTAFLDLPAASHEAGTAFWAAVTGYEPSSLRGDHDEFRTLVPPDADPFLRVQRVSDGPGGLHLDLHVGDPRAAADRAVALGATEVADRGYVVLRSPGGLPFCHVLGGAGRSVPAASEWPDSRSIADQVVLDIPADGFEAECAFWAELTGWSFRGFAEFPEFGHLLRPAGMPVRLLLQRLGEEAGSVRAHLDVAADHRPEEVRRHEALGATVRAQHQHWTVLEDPTGTTYCVVDRDLG